MTNKQALREAAEKATKGEWAVEFDDEVYSTDGVNSQQIAMVFSENESLDAAFIAAASPVTVLALLDELEAAHSYAKDRDEENQDLMLTIGRLRVERETIEYERDNALCELLPDVQYMDPPDGGCVTPMEQVRRMVADYRERIAELEAREVTLPKVQDIHPLGPQSAKVLCEFHRNIVNRCADEIRKIGVKVSIKGD